MACSDRDQPWDSGGTEARPFVQMGIGESVQLSLEGSGRTSLEQKSRRGSKCRRREEHKGTEGHGGTASLAGVVWEGG